MACKKFNLKEGWIITESESQTISTEGITIRIIPITVYLTGIAERG
jgi:hypothetical protein